MKIDPLGRSEPRPRPSAPPETAPHPRESAEIGTAEEVLPPPLAEILVRAGRPYYDPARDRRDSDRYYAEVERRLDGTDPKACFRALGDLVTKTHENKLGYDPDKYLYGWVDLRPNLRLRSLYSSRPVEAGDPVRVAAPKDLQEVVVEEVSEAPARPVRKSRHGKKSGRSRKVAKTRTRKVVRSLEEQAKQWVQALASGPTDAVSLARRIAEIETRTYFNCEHVVPRIWFADEQPMRGDLHHLFTAEHEANSLRSSRRLVDFEDYDGSNDPTQMGKAPYGSTEYEPAGGRGAAARATLYFLLRYPGKVGGDPREYTREDVEALLRWHREEPPSLYERHRNQEIFRLQGNRNPLIDHPEWADRVDFGMGLRTPIRRPPARPAGPPPPWQGTRR